MISQASIESLSDILDLESSNFVRYIQEVAELRPSRPGDAEAVALFEELYLDSSSKITELSALLAERPANGVNYVGLAAAVGTYHPGDSGWQVADGPLHRRLEADQLKLLDAQSFSLGPVPRESPREPEGDGHERPY